MKRTLAMVLSVLMVVFYLPLNTLAIYTQGEFQGVPETAGHEGEPDGDSGINEEGPQDEDGGNPLPSDAKDKEGDAENGKTGESNEAGEEGQSGEGSEAGEGDAQDTGNKTSEDGLEELPQALQEEIVPLAALNAVMLIELDITPIAVPNIMLIKQGADPSEAKHGQFFGTVPKQGSVTFAEAGTYDLKITYRQGSQYSPNSVTHGAIKMTLEVGDDRAISLTAIEGVDTANNGGYTLTAGTGAGYNATLHLYTLPTSSWENSASVDLTLKNAQGNTISGFNDMLVTLYDEDGCIIQGHYSFFADTLFLPKPVKGGSRTISFKVEAKDCAPATGVVKLTRSSFSNSASIDQTASSVEGAAEYSFTSKAINIKLEEKIIAKEFFNIGFAVVSDANANMKVRVYDSGGSVVSEGITHQIKVSDLTADSTYTYTVTADNFRTFEGSFQLKTDGTMLDLTTAAQKQAAVYYQFDAENEKFSIKLTPMPDITPRPQDPAGIFSVELGDYINNAISFGDHTMTGSTNSGGVIGIHNPTKWKMKVVDYEFDKPSFSFTRMLRSRNEILSFVYGKSESNITVRECIDIADTVNANYPGTDAKDYYDVLLWYFKANPAGKAEYQQYAGISTMEEVKPEHLQLIWKDSNPTFTSSELGDVTAEEHLKWLMHNTEYDTYGLLELDDRVNELAKYLVFKYAIYFSFDGTKNELPNEKFDIEYKDGNPNGLSLAAYAEKTEENRKFFEQIFDGVVIDPDGTFTLDNICLAFMGDLMHNSFQVSMANFNLPILLKLRAIGIDGYVYLDTNEDGVFSEGDQVLKDIEVKLLRDNGGTIETVETVKTAENGYYLFENYGEGKYKVQTTIPAEYLPSGTSDNPSGNHFQVGEEGAVYETGWFTVEELDDNITNNAEMKEPDPDMVTITYRPNSGTGDEHKETKESPMAHKILSDEEVGFTKENHTFLGWNPAQDASAGDSQYAPGETITLTEDLILYAIWKANDEEDPGIKITYNANGGVGDDVVDNHKGEGKYQIRTADSAKFTYENYTFRGWSTNKEGPADNAYAPGTEVELESDLILYAIWLKDSEEDPGIKVTYNANGGAGNDVVDNHKGEGKYQIRTADSAKFTYENYTFRGWSTNKEGPADNAYAPGTEVELESDLTLYAIWLKDSEEDPSIKVTYNANGGAGNDVVDTHKEEGKYQIRTVASTEFTREGYTFRGWSTNKDGPADNAYAPGTEVELESDLILYAIWEKDGEEEPGIKVTYRANGGTGADIVDTHKGEGTYQIRTRASAGFTRSGYSFQGWSTSSSGSASGAYDPGTKVQLKGDLVLYAVWQRDSRDDREESVWYTLTYHSGNQEQSERHSAGSNVKVKAGSIFTAPRGMEFTGWSLTESGEKVYSPGDTFRMPARDMHLYAIYEGEDLLNKEDHYAYIIGYPDGTVRPQTDITRAEVITIFFRLLTDEARDAYWSSTNPFADVNRGDWYNNAYSTLYKVGIIEGYGGFGTPNTPITRAEVAAIAARFDTANTKAGSRFSDTAGHWAEEEIGRAAANGWVTGYTDGTFRPDRNITRAEMMALVNRVLERHIESDAQMTAGAVTWPDNKKSEWYFYEVQEATNSHYYNIEDGEEVWTRLRTVRDWAALERR